MKFNKIHFLLVLVLFAGCKHANVKTDQKATLQNVLEKTKVKAEVDGKVFRDLNGNGKLDIYEDINQPIEARIEDLLGQMTLEEKAGMMFINGAPVNEDASLDKKEGAQGPAARVPAAIGHISSLKMIHFNIWDIPEDPATLAKWYNNLQQYAEQSRLGIPITIASDPRHHFSNNIFAMSAQGFSQFCETLGFAAIGSDTLVK